MVGPLGSKLMLMRSTPIRSYIWYQAKENAKEEPKNRDFMRGEFLSFNSDSCYALNLESWWLSSSCNKVVARQNVDGPMRGPKELEEFINTVIYFTRASGYMKQGPKIKSRVTKRDLFPWKLRYTLQQYSPPMRYQIYTTELLLLLYC